MSHPKAWGPTCIGHTKMTPFRTRSFSMVATNQCSGTKFCLDSVSSTPWSRREGSLGPSGGIFLTSSTNLISESAWDNFKFVFTTQLNHIKSRLTFSTICMEQIFHKTTNKLIMTFEVDLTNLKSINFSPREAKHYIFIWLDRYANLQKKKEFAPSVSYVC